MPITEFLEKNSLFVANDLSKTALKPFFPANSEYYSTIVSMNNQWFNRHEPIKFTNHNVEKFFAYTDNLAYVHVTMNEEFIISGYNIAQCIKVDLPLWLVKMDGNWYVARILFEDSTRE